MPFGVYEPPDEDEPREEELEDEEEEPREEELEDEEDEPREEEPEDEEDEPFELDAPAALAAPFAEAAAEALIAAAILAPRMPIYFAPFPMRPSRWSMTASCSRVSGACGAEPSVIPASVSAFHASEAQALAFLPSFSFS